jgi:hypothetical protein
METFLSHSRDMSIPLVGYIGRRSADPRKIRDLRYKAIELPAVAANGVGNFSEAAK